MLVRSATTVVHVVDPLAPRVSPPPALLGRLSASDLSVLSAAVIESVSKPEPGVLPEPSPVSDPRPVPDPGPVPDP
jgi:hypothetical protein